MSKNDELTEKQMAEIKQRKRDYVSTFSTPEGKRVLADLERVCYVHKSTFSMQDRNGLMIAFREGMRFVVVNIKNTMALDLETLIKLTQKGE